MSTLNVGSGQPFATIADAVNASHSGDTIAVAAGTYTNDFVTIRHDLALLAVGGTVTMQATVQPPNGKAILTEGGAGISVTIDGFAFTGATVPDGNGAGIRYEGGTLSVTRSHFYGNENGILGAPDANGAISVDRSEFDHNGVGGSGYTHNLYIGDIARFSLTNSYIHDANVGHEVKSRAENNVITGNVIVDGNSTSSYEIDLPNAGNSVISGNVIEQGPNSQNPNIIAYGEEGSLHAGTSLSVTNNTIVNDLGRGPALWNGTGTVATFANNLVYGFGSTPLVNGPANQTGTVALDGRPTFAEAVPPAPQASPSPSPSPTPSAPPSSGSPYPTPPASTAPASTPAADPGSTTEAPSTPPVAPPVAPDVAPDVGTTVFRFFDRASGTQFLTASPTERDAILAARPDLTSEGTGFGAMSAGDGAASVFRFFDTTTGTHFMTSSAAERDEVAATRSDLIDEGVGFFESATAQPGLSAVYRFFDSNAGTHFFTASQSEHAALLTTRPDLIAEGIAFYAPT